MINDDETMSTDARAASLAASVYLSAGRAACALREVAASGTVARVIGSGVLDGCERILLVGSGGSYAAMLTAQMLLDGMTATPVHATPGLDVLWRRPAGLSPRCGVVLASASGRTADIVDALPVLRAARCPTLAITGAAGSVLDEACDQSIIYPGDAIYEVPVVATLQLVAGLGALSERAVAVLAACEALADALEDAVSVAPDRMNLLAKQLASSEHIYVIGAGPMSALAYKLAPVLMENVRVGASYFDVAEFRHGSIEFVERHRPTVLGLLGTDQSRETVAGLFRFLADRGADVHVVDSADYTIPHPALAPLVLNAVTQWFVAWSATLRGIDDLDERVYMGRGLLSSGSWP